MIGFRSGRRISAVLLIVWPLVLASGVVVRQSRPFRVKSDDRAYYALATKNAAAARRAAASDGLMAGLRAFGEGCSVTQRLPAHVHRKRPALIWVWSTAYLAAGDQGLVWTWRTFYILTIFSLFLLLRHLSTTSVASILAGIVAVAPSTQGLLSWMACATYLISYPFLLLGSFLLLNRRGLVGTIAGLTLLMLALLSREVAFLLVPIALGLFLYQMGRRRVACLLPILAVTLWLLLPGEGRSAMGTLRSDPLLFFRGAFLVGAGELAALVRNLGLLVLCPLVVLLWGGFLSLGLILVVCSFFYVPVQLLLPIALAIVALSRSRQSIFGLVWMFLAILAMCLYGHFSSRYAFEPLVGLTLAMGPAMATFRPRALFWIVPFALWFAAVSLAPDRLYRSTFLRTATLEIDQRLQTLHAVTLMRHKDYQSFGGRVTSTWNAQEDLEIASLEADSLRGFVWTTGRFWRAGSSPGLHCRQMEHVVFTRENIWEWNVWYWRVLPARKGRGIHVELPGVTWTVHPGETAPSHDECLFIRSNDRPLPSARRPDAVRDWLADTPELNNPGRARGWLNEVWATEGWCHTDLASSPFLELELGGLFIRDDGWLDLLELSYLRDKVRER